MKRVIILRGEDWEACYVDGKSVAQAHSLGEGRGRLKFLQEQAKEHDFALHDVVEVGIEPVDEEMARENGDFPQKFSDLQGIYTGQIL